MNSVHSKRFEVAFLCSYAKGPNMSYDLPTSEIKMWTINQLKQNGRAIWRSLTQSYAEQVKKAKLCPRKYIQVLAKMYIKLGVLH